MEEREDLRVERNDLGIDLSFTLASLLRVQRPKSALDQIRSHLS
jgi:hypothetical protein